MSQKRIRTSAGWGTVFENDEHGLWVGVRSGRDEYSVPHPWVRLPRRR